jgi:hypothetical protein
MNRIGGGLLTFVVLFTLWTNSAPRGIEPNEHPAAGPQSNEAGSSRSSLPQADDSLSKYPEELQDTLKAFYLEESDAEKKTWGCPAPAIDKKLLTEMKSMAPEVVLAIIPDPAHTHLSLFFDRQVDAIQQAAQDKGYYFDRAIMPWDSRDHLEPTDFRLRLKEEHYQHCRETQPGLMIFRPPKGEAKTVQETRNQSKNYKKNPQADKPPAKENAHYGALLVFVVGETPTGGVRHDQFQKAVDYTFALLGSNQPPATLPPLRILGPTFSGSLYSLRALIESETNDKTRFSEFRVYSGSANSYESTEEFRRFLLSHKGSFASFQESAELQELLFVRFLVGRGYAASQIAILSEDETAYGGFGRRDDSPPGETERPSCFWECQKSTSVEEARIQKSVVHVYFPREIAQLRSAYQREIAAPRSGSSEKESFRSTLKLDLTDSGSDDDSVRTYSHRQLPLSQEGVLLGIVTTLHKHAVEFVILRATDPLDTVFLARYLRSASPNVRIVTAGNDLLLRREIDDRLLFGILSINTYSMRPGANDWLPNSGWWPVHQERVFPGPDSVGTYNAMTGLLSPNEMVEEIRKSTPTPEQCTPNDVTDKQIRFGWGVRLQEYGWPTLGGAPQSTTVGVPPIWVTVLGRDGFWPVALLTPSSECSDPVSHLPLLNQRPSPPLEGSQPPATWAWRMLCGFLIVLVLLYICLLWKGSVLSNLSTSQVSQQLAVRAGDCRLHVFAIQGLLLLGTVSLVLWPWLHGLLKGCWLWGMALGATAILLVWTVGQDLRRRWKRVAPEDPHRKWKYVLFSNTPVAALIVVFIGMLWSVFRCLADNSVDNMFIYRYVHIAWWVSPLVPILFLMGAGLWWSWYTIQGATLLDDRKPFLPKAASETGLSSELERLTEGEPDIEKLLGLLTPGKWNPRVHWAVIGFIILGLSLTDYRHPVSSLEDRWYDIFFGVLLLAVLGALLSSLLRLYLIWTSAKRLLIRLDGTRLRYGFGRLPGYAWMPFWGLGASPLPDRERLVRLEVEALQTACNTVESDKKPGLKKQLDAVRGSVEDLQKAINKNSIDLLVKLKDLYDKIAIAAGATLEYLTKKWEDEPDEERTDARGNNETEIHCHCHTDESESAKGKRATKAAEYFVALVYASFIQAVLIRLRCLMIGVCGMFVFIIASFNAYPFSPKGSLNSLSIFLLLVIAGVIGLVFGQIRRDATLSRITDTAAGQLGADFWLKLAQFGALPILSLLTSLYPEVGSFLFSWLEPAMQALGK